MFKSILFSLYLVFGALWASGVFAETPVHSLASEQDPKIKAAIKDYAVLIARDVDAHATSGGGLRAPAGMMPENGKVAVEVSIHADGKRTAKVVFGDSTSTLAAKMQKLTLHAIQRLNFEHAAILDNANYRFVLVYTLVPDGKDSGIGLSRMFYASILNQELPSKEES